MTLLSAAIARYRANHPRRHRDPTPSDLEIALAEATDDRLAAIEKRLNDYIDLTSPAT